MFHVEHSNRCRFEKKQCSTWNICEKFPLHRHGAATIYRELPRKLGLFLADHKILPVSKEARLCYNNKHSPFFGAGPGGRHIST